MALLHSLQLCGIRSFSPDSQETINFNSPVTLFLGQNGCGKTTIIESICYALSGELPSGTSGGQGFLNDPKMTNRRTTKGNIKIKFYDNTGNKLTMCRAMSVTIKQDGKYQFKRLNCTIRKKDKDDPDSVVDLSGRIKDIDNYCATALNVSKAILNNVIFCHQENSTWPLDEGQKLKDKFDKIFESERYNKCIESYRKRVKDLKTKESILKERLKSKELIKDQADQLKAKSSGKKENYEKIMGQIESKTQDMAPMQDRWNEILELEESLGLLQRQLTSKETELKGLTLQQAKINKDITEIFEGSDEELQNRMQSFNAERSADEGLIAQMEHNKNQMDSGIKRLDAMIQRRQMDMGRINEEIKQYKKKKEESENLIDKLRLELSLGEFATTDDEISKIRKLEDTLEKSHANFKKLEEQHETEEKALQKQIDDARVTYASTTEKLTSKNNAIRDCNDKVKDINGKLNSLCSSDSQLKKIDYKLEQLQNNLRKYKETFNEAAKVQEIEELKDKVRKQEHDLDKLEKEFRVLQNNYVTEEKLHSLNTELIKKQGDISRIMNKHSEAFKRLFGDNIPEIKLKESVEKIRIREEDKHKMLTTRINSLEKEIASIQTNLKMNEKTLDNEKKELAKLQKKVYNLCQDKPYKELLNETANKKEKLQKMKGTLSSAKIMYEEFANKIEKEACCPVCQTNFSRKNQMIGEITTKLRGKVAILPSQIEETAADLRKIEDFYNKLQQLNREYEQINILTSTKIPQLEAEIGGLNNKLEELSVEVFSEKEALKTPLDLLQICKDVLSDAVVFDQYSADVGRIRDSIENLEGEIVKVPSNRSRQETEAEIDNLKSQLHMNKNQLESSKEMLDNHKERCQNCNKEIQNYTQQQINIQMMMNEKPLLEKEKKECEQKLTVLNEDIEQLSIDKISQEHDLNTLIIRKEGVVKNNKEQRREEQNKLRLHSSILGDIDKVQKDLNRYEKNNSEEKLRVAAEDLAKITVEREELVNNKEDIMKNISKKEQSLAKRETELRALKDNVVLRENKKTCEKLDTDIKQLKEKIGKYNYRTVYEEKQRLEKQIEKAKREVNVLKGQKDELHNQIEELEKELDKPQIKNAYREYTQQWFELDVHEVLTKDMSAFVSVLEQSVLQFHKERMVHINRIIRDLWRSIYRGNDIDYIEIKNDSTTGTTSKRTYNYSVVQVKNNVELEMRGRCSAGQKVLACLVIRMALAESFSSTCGILALDEPTTNLDKENIQSLSDALSRIISAREKEQNFQLLIITHDEEFLHTLSRVQSLESYYKVKRNNSGFSMIEKDYL